MKDKVEMKESEVVMLTNVFRTYECRMHEMANLCLGINSEFSTQAFRETLLEFLCLCNTYDYDIDTRLLAYLDEASLRKYSEDRQRI